MADPVSINRRSAVLAQLQAAATNAGRTLNISLTLPVLPSGLDNNGLYVLQSAVSNHVNLTCVNIMAMDFGDNAAPSPAGKMGTYSIMAATNLFNQMKSVYQAANITKSSAQLWQMIGVTPMLGVNDAQDEIFDQTAAGQLVSFAESQHAGRLAFWSLNRDVPGGSGITQTAFQFTGIFLPYSGGTNPAPVLTVANAGATVPTNGVAYVSFPVTLIPASTGTVSVAYFTGNGTAVAPTNYYATNGTLTFTPGQTGKTVLVTVPGTTNAGANTVFYLNLTNATGANAYFPQATGYLTNNNVAPGGGGSGGGGSGGGGSGGECALTTQWTVTYDIASVFQATLTLNNPNPTNIALNSFTFSAPYTNIDYIDAGSPYWWVPTTHTGTNYTIGSGWSTPPVIPAGGSLQLNFQGEPGGTAPPVNLLINGVTVGHCSGFPFYFTKVQRTGTNVVLTWATMGGMTNYVQMSSSLTGTNWTTLTGPLVISGNGATSTNWTHLGGATNGAARFYRLMIP